MRLPTIIWLATFATLCVAEEQQSLWSWNANADESKEKQTYAVEAQNPGGSAPEDQANYNETSSALSVDDVIDTILSSTRQGRNLDGFDEVYSDPTVQDAIQKGDDSQARNLIKDKLCTLGLMQCENEENVEGKRPFLPGGDFIYAQPPNGNGPYHNQPRPPTKIMYGPPRPMPNNFGPPRKVGYVGHSSRPIYSSIPGPPIISSGPPPDFQGPIYHSKPPGPVYEGGSPYKFESYGGHSSHGHEEHHELGLGGLSGLSDGGLIHGQPKPTIVVNAHGGAALNGGPAAPSSVNVHHHYHHLDKDAAQIPSVVVPVPVPVGNGLGVAEFSSHGHHEPTGAGFSGAGSGFDYQNFKQSSANGFSGVNGGGFSGGLSSGHGGLGGPTNSGGFSSGVNGFSASSGYGAGVKPVFESVNNYDSHAAANSGPAVFGGQGSPGLGGSLNSYGQSLSGVYNGNTGSFHSGNPDYYKKALGGNSGYNSISSNKQQFAGGYAGQYGANYNGGDNYQSSESARQDNVDCVCVPFDQCPARDVFGRKGDLILPLDPRNLGTDIEALSDDENANGTASAVVRVTKEATEKKEEKEVEKDAEKTDEEPAISETKKISKRDVSEKKSDNVAKADGEAVSLYFIS